MNESYYLVVSARFQIPLEVDRDVVSQIKLQK
jgi:hypothetical protein